MNREDQDIVQDIECMFGFHDWTKWETFSKGEVLRSLTDFQKAVGQKPAVIGYYEHQRRYCLNCGKSQLSETEV